MLALLCHMGGKGVLTRYNEAFPQGSSTPVRGASWVGLLGVPNLVVFVRSEAVFVRVRVLILDGTQMPTWQGAACISQFAVSTDHGLSVRIQVGALLKPYCGRFTMIGQCKVGRSTQ